ncbi:branched-chain amino acid ABC transporter permease [Xanthobacter dioxanivorans]|uniref:Branched-chain amino acid ABC transporter permease n=1 Tax=Xanthobacter dioxanivorans TaxID=2528964 RepID=A0A974SH88_9HYPH|nr:branched-chain amino acid ABC transporter permease [Xanthobacter dioxanivorans]QRG06026.1 branched-chain amino acid ABC transporter permease [Xanthobacter dioxanivorans]
MTTSELVAERLAERGPVSAGATLDRWRVPLTVAVLCVLPWVLPSQALAVNVLIYGLFTVGFNLLFGYTGLLSFGHAAFFGGGAYLTGMAIHYLGFGWFPAMVTGVLGASVLAAAIGALSIRTRGIYFCMVTLALAQLVFYLALQASSVTGGENGLRGFTVTRAVLPGGLSVNLLDPMQKYYFLMVFAALALWFVSRVLNSPFGAAIEAVRENETRARACGFDVERTKLLSFVLSGGVCGLAGAMSALHLAIVPLDALGVQTSSVVVMMTMLGGAGSFFGPFAGALMFLLIEDVASLWTSHWQLIVGVIFILFVLFLPKGIWGSLIVLARREGRGAK